MPAERGNRSRARGLGVRGSGFGPRGRGCYTLTVAPMSIDSRDVEGLTEIFRVLGDPTRVRILDALSRAELCVGDLASGLGVTDSAVSPHPRLPRSARSARGGVVLHGAGRHAGARPRPAGPPPRRGGTRRGLTVMGRDEAVS